MIRIVIITAAALAGLYAAMAVYFHYGFKKKFSL